MANEHFENPLPVAVQLDRRPLNGEEMLNGDLSYSLAAEHSEEGTVMIPYRDITS
ncbi:hypothetical protein [Sagittula sp. SSi028]|uniref:hypothetical protein n=1 Tax=Sagittula sp. SSi028 TaxID=3400636 RepID=UPI003AF73FD6